METGAVILDAGMSSRMGSFKPLLEIGDLSAVRRIILTLRAAGAEPVVLITGNQAEALESHVSNLGVIPLRNERYADTQMLDSVRIGLRYLKGRCGQVLLTPVDVPLFSVKTVRVLIEYGAVSREPVFAVPAHGGKSGHPLLISSEMIPIIEAYDGTGGLAGAIRASGRSKYLLEVDDAGVLLDMDTPGDYRRILEQYNTIAGEG